MRRFTLPTASRWLAVVVLALWALGPASAQAQTPTAPTLLFLDERDLRVDFNRLTEQALTIEVFNRADTPQPVEVQVVGLSRGGRPDPKLARLLPQPVDQTINKGGVGVFTLRFLTHERPDPGVYAGYIVATGEQGDMIRRKLILEVRAADQAGSLPPVIKVEGRDTLAVSGVNYLPSLLSPLLPGLLLLLFGVAGVLALASVPRDRQNLPLALVVAVVGALVLLLVGEWGTRAAQNWLRPLCAAASQSPAREVCRALAFGLEPSLVVATPVSVAPLTGPTQGEAVAPVGGGKLVVANGVLTVQDVPRAGKYEWQVDLRPDDAEQGAVGITAQVADWWPWAALTLGLGLLLGRQVTQYFQTRRGQAQQTIRCQRLRESIPGAEKAFWDKYPDLATGDLQAVRVTPVAEKWLQEVNDALQGGATEAAQASLDSLESYLAAFRLLREGLVQLHAQRDAVWESTVDWVALDDDNIEIFAAVKAEFNRPFEYTTPPQALKDVQARLDRVAAYQDWLAALDRTLRLVAAYDDHADAIPEGTEDQQDRLEGLRAGLRKAAALAITTNRRRRVDEQNDQADEIGQAIEELHLEIDRAAGQRRDGARLRLPEPTAPDEGGARGFLDLFGPPGGRPEVAAERRALSAAELQRLFQQSELQMSGIAGLIAVGSGLLALYFSNPTWGTPADYLKALLWGSTVSEGLKYVNVLLRRVWG